jgi:hypothetical protein
MVVLVIGSRHDRTNKSSCFKLVTGEYQLYCMLYVIVL